MRQKLTTKEKAVQRRIWNLDTDALMKMDLAKFCLLREQADTEGRRQLDYLLNQAQLKETIRKIVREELAKAGIKGIKHETKK